MGDFAPMDVAPRHWALVYGRPKDDIHGWKAYVRGHQADTRGCSPATATWRSTLALWQAVFR
jgi:hypothetical protein